MAFILVTGLFIDPSNGGAPLFGTLIIDDLLSIWP